MALAGEPLCILAGIEHSCATGAQAFAMQLHAQVYKAEAQKAQMQSSRAGNNAVDDGAHDLALHNVLYVRVPQGVPSACSWNHENGIPQIVRLCASLSWHGQMQTPCLAKAHTTLPALLQKAGHSEFF
ncbi:hypothetical protein [Acetobacter ascendens]|uniref:hypothetical protein n=1 Tax=Acetobacter ascendens TaxID=481146 RepID=UPI000875AB34|nr:hypothetical protein [Acetobacter ascendens]AOW49278.1 hypothetical protein A4R89_07455 [Acetobacter ascendens]